MKAFAFETRSQSRFAGSAGKDRAGNEAWRPVSHKAVRLGSRARTGDSLTEGHTSQFKQIGSGLDLLVKECPACVRVIADTRLNAQVKKVKRSAPVGEVHPPRVLRAPRWISREVLKTGN